MDIALDKVCSLIRQARRFDVKEGISDPDSGSNPADDNQIDVLEPTADDSTESEIRSFVTGLNVDEQANLVALVWLRPRAISRPRSLTTPSPRPGSGTRTRRRATSSAFPTCPICWMRVLRCSDLSCVDEDGGAGV